MSDCKSCGAATSNYGGLTIHNSFAAQVACTSKTQSGSNGAR